jgi:metallo-beta-lactamase family protein
MRITFHGAAGEVTGSMHLLEIGTKRVLLDCGLFQGRREEARQKNEQFPAEVTKVDAVILSHAHIDHCGRLPLLVKNGYRGPIYCTSATKDLVEIMLADAGHIQESDAAFLAKRGTKIEPLYTANDAARVSQQTVAVAYDTPFDVLSDLRLTFKDAGHILGSAFVNLEIAAPGGTKRIVFSGDIGRAGLPIIRDPQSLPGPAPDALIVESTYAGRVHETVGDAQSMLGQHISRVAKRGGKVMIPAFALGRTQEIVYELHRLVAARQIPTIPIYVDSPLAVSATDIFSRHPECFDLDADMLRRVSGVFQFAPVTYVRSVEESKALNTLRGPAVIIAASGMAESGRILHHLLNGLPNERNMCLLVGFTASYTLGDRLRQGAKEVRILGQMVTVRAEVQMVAGYSAHGDKNDLSTWIRGLGPAPKRAFAVHGEAGLAAMAEILKDMRVPDVQIPALHQGFEL